jgi:hypothetical protein
MKPKGPTWTCPCGAISHSLDEYTSHRNTCPEYQSLRNGQAGDDSKSPDKAKTVNLLVVSGVAGRSFYIDNYRVYGEKPWGGGSTLYECNAPREDVLHALHLDKAGAHDPWSKDNGHNWCFCEHPVRVLVRKYEADLEAKEAELREAWAKRTNLISQHFECVASCPGQGLGFDVCRKNSGPEFCDQDHDEIVRTLLDHSLDTIVVIPVPKSEGVEDGQKKDSGV